MAELDFLKDDGDLQQMAHEFLKEKKIKEHELWDERHLRDFLGTLKVLYRVRFLLRGWRVHTGEIQERLEASLLGLFSSQTEAGVREETFKRVRETGEIPLLKALLLRSVEAFGEESLHPLLDCLQPDEMKALKEQMESEGIAGRVKEALERFQPRRGWRLSTPVYRKILFTRLECWSNTPQERFGNLTPFEASHSPTHRDAVIAEIYKNTSDPQLLTHYFSLLSFPEGNRRYIEAFQRTGGLLNLFHLFGGREIDPLWEEWMKKLDAEAFEPAERERRLEQMAQEWNQTPQEFFGGLSPAMVVAGGGPVENQLLSKFLTYLDQKIVGSSEEEQGKKEEEVKLLHSQWLDTPASDGESPRTHILLERRAILDKKLQWLRSRVPTVAPYRERVKKKKPPRRR